MDPLDADLLDFWLVLAPFSFGYLNEALWVQSSGGHGTTHSSGCWSRAFSDTIKLQECDFRIRARFPYRAELEAWRTEH